MRETGGLELASTITLVLQAKAISLTTDVGIKMGDSLTLFAKQIAK